MASLKRKVTSGRQPQERESKLGCGRVYDTGKLIDVGKYNDGKKTGVWKIYPKNGTLIREKKIEKSGTVLTHSS